MDRTRLRELLMIHFNETELEDLCFDLNIDYETLPGNNKADKVRELIRYCERDKRTADLMAACRKAHPSVFTSLDRSSESSAGSAQVEPTHGAASALAWWKRVPVWSWALIGLVIVMGAAVSLRGVIAPTPVSELSPTATWTATPFPQAIKPSDTPAPARPSDTPTPMQTVAPSSTPCPPLPQPVGKFAAIWQSMPDKLGCATGNASTVKTAMQLFQKGLMLWRQDKLEIYALFGDATWSRHADTWKQDVDAPSSCTGGTPMTPEHGFGKVWCTVSTVRNGLGGATAGESSSTATVQDFDYGLILRMDSGETYVMYRGGWAK